jgi:6-phosphogluconolactonase/glucosamine-6-phosphate isomerase/deaminase
MNIPAPDGSAMAEGAAQRAAILLAQSAMHALATRPAFHAALCGGPLLDDTMQALARLPAFRRIDWRHVILFAIDDSWDETSMSRLAACPLPRDNIRRPRVADVARHDAAHRYEQQLAASFGIAGGSLPVFDFVLLAEDDDGRVAGYTANDKDAATVTRLVVAHERGVPRVALALPVIDAARTVVLACNSPRSPCVRLLNPHRQFHLLSASTARSSGAATPPTLRASRSIFPPT